MSTTNEHLQRIVSYWKACIEAEDALSADLSPNARTKALLSPYGTDPFVFGSTFEPVLVDDEKLLNLTRRIQVAEGDLFYGYPVLLFQDDQGKSRLAPLLIMKIDIISTNGNNSLVPEEPIPEIGLTAMSKFGLRSEEVAALSNEITQLVSRNVNAPRALAKSYWDIILQEADPKFVEETDPENVGNEKISRTGIFGVYNRAIFYEGETRAYNRALLEDLEELKHASDLEHSALSFLIAKEGADDSAAEEHVPALAFEANEYQIAAIRRALSSSLTVVTGPPGTGKSQFIENLLLSLYVRGKKVLLVSHTNEAVQVVYDRLKQEVGTVALRTGSSEHRKSLSSQYRAMLTELQTTTSPGTADNKELGDSWQKIQEQRAVLIKIRELQQSAGTLAESLYSRASTLGEPEDVFRSARAVVADADEFIHRLQSISIMREVNFGRGPLLLRILRRFRKPLFQRIVDSKLRKIQTRIPSEVLDVFAPREKTISFSDMDDPAIDRLSGLLSFAQSARDLFSMEEELRKYPKRLSVERDISTQIHLYSQLSRRVLRTYVARRLGETGGSSGATISFLDQLGQVRGNDTQVRMPTVVLPTLPLWSCTLKSVRRSFPLRLNLFDYVVFDEASQVDLPSAAPALYRAAKVIVVGDPKQLTHIATITKEQEFAIAGQTGIQTEQSLYPNLVKYDDVSLYKSAERSLPSPPVLLAQHYRSQGEIIGLCNQAFYEGQLRVLTDEDFSSWPTGLPKGLQWIDCKGSSSKHPAGSRYNNAEINEVMKTLRNCISQLDGRPLNIGVVTPFSRQRTILQSRIAAEFDQSVIDLHQLKVQTAHQYQGSERDIMIFSLVASGTGNGGSDRWFNFYPQILNVALSRARRLLYLIGDKEYCTSRPGILGTIAATYDSIKIKHNVAEQWDVGNLDSEEERILYDKLLQQTNSDENIRVVPKRRVGPYSLDIALEGTVQFDIECDGSQHQIVDGLPVIEDVRRDNYISRHGWKVIRILNHRIRSDLDRVVDEIMNQTLQNGVD